MDEIEELIVKYENKSLKEPCEKDFEECKKCNHLGSSDCSRFVNDFKLEDFQYCARCGQKYCNQHN